MKHLPLLLPLALCSCLSTESLRKAEAANAALAVSLGELANDLDEAKAEGRSTRAELGSQVGDLVGRLMDVAAEAKEAGDTAAEAAEENEANKARLEAALKTGAGGLRQFGPLGEIGALVLTGAATAFGVNRSRDKKYVAAAPTSTTPKT